MNDTTDPVSRADSSIVTSNASDGHDVIECDTFSINAHRVSVTTTAVTNHSDTHVSQLRRRYRLRSTVHDSTPKQQRLTYANDAQPTKTGQCCQPAKVGQLFSAYKNLQISLWHTNDFCRPTLSADNIGQLLSVVCHQRYFYFITTCMHALLNQTVKFAVFICQLAEQPVKLHIKTRFQVATG